MQCSCLIFLQAQARSVLSAWSGCNVCGKCFFPKSSESGALPKGSWRDLTPSIVKAWEKPRKIGFIILALFIFIVSFH